MCEWLKKLFGCKCSCKDCNCDEEKKEEAVIEVETPVSEPLNEEPVSSGSEDEAQNL